MYEASGIEVVVSLLDEPDDGKTWVAVPAVIAREALASVHPETVSFWNDWLNRGFWRRKARRFRISCGCMPLQSETLLTAGADNASGTHHPGHYIRNVCAARDRLRVEGDVAVAGWPRPADQPGRG